MKSKSSSLSVSLRFLALLLASSIPVLGVIAAAAQADSSRPFEWRSVGPYGGDARAFAAVPGDPRHLYLGGTNNWIFESRDAGAHWLRLSRVGSNGSDDIVDNLIVDEQDHNTLFVGIWRVDRPDGGLYVSHDAGRTWTSIPALAGQSVRSLAQAPSDPAMLVAGTLEGVYRSLDHGATWLLISPPESKEIHEVESLAVDPRHPQTIYAGTWHLPWKTTDGGEHWHNIKEGVIDDSDVFSIIVDPKEPAIVYISACSGIYKSENGGELFHKVQGIPSTARRTRVLMQDEKDRNLVYAGTTEGLYRTKDAGRTWDRVTGDDVIINDIYLDPAHRGHMLLATDRGGVLASDDSGANFRDSNPGFSARKVEALIVDRAASSEISTGTSPDSGSNSAPVRILAGIVNDKKYGGAFLSQDGGKDWQQIAAGLEGRDVFTLAQAKDGTILAGTSHGIFALVNLEGNEDGSAQVSADVNAGVNAETKADGEKQSNPESRQDSKAEASTDPAALAGPHWEMRSTIINSATRVVSTVNRGKRINRQQTYTLGAREMSSRVAAFDLSGDVWVASTAEGVFTSADQGASWQGGLVLGSAEYHSLAAWGGKLYAARREGVVLSADKGKSWNPMRLPSKITDIRKIVFARQGELWIGTGNGVYVSRDHGETWFWLDKVPVRDVNDLDFDAQAGRMLATSRSSQVVYSIDPDNFAFTGSDAGYPVFLVRSSGGLHFAASLQDGVLLDPQSAPKSSPQSAPTPDSAIIKQ